MEWIRGVPGGEGKAFCKYCKSEIRAHHSELITHSKTEKHMRNIAPVSNCRTLFDIGLKPVKVDNSVKTSELKLAAHIACLSSILTVDHLGGIVSDIAQIDINLHKTKCSALIRNVIGPVMQQELLQDIGNILYALIIEESTDISTYMSVVARYFSKKLECIVSSFAGIIHLSAGEAASITQALIEFLQNNTLSIKQCIGLATDGCNTMCGRNNSVLTKFRQQNPNIVFIKCFCHSIQLCSSKALNALPRNFDCMILQTYAWFSHSTVRQQNYHELYAIINVGEAPLKNLTTF
ncbi:UNVERIFIED_CONTAM: hypothetical protein FKN15_059488 [Acipenser sinensis]